MYCPYEETKCIGSHYNNIPTKQHQNGRVTHLQQPSDYYTLFTKEKFTNTKNILYGTLERTALSDAFFSPENITNIQNRIIHTVYTASNGKYKIGRQSETDLIVICRAIYLQHSKHLPYHMEQQINELNRLVTEYCVPRIISEIEQHLHYRQQLQYLPTPITYPRNVSIKGTKTLRSTTSTF